jgi:hypothetical protein
MDASAWPSDRPSLDSRPDPPADIWPYRLVPTPAAGRALCRHREQVRLIIHAPSSDSRRASPLATANLDALHGRRHDPAKRRVTRLLAQQIAGHRRHPLDKVLPAHRQAPSSRGRRCGEPGCASSQLPRTAKRPPTRETAPKLVTDAVSARSATPRRTAGQAPGTAVSRRWRSRRRRCGARLRWHGTRSPPGDTSWVGGVIGCPGVHQARRGA